MSKPTFLSPLLLIAACSNSPPELGSTGQHVVEQAPLPRPVAKCLATCYLKTDVTYKVNANSTTKSNWGGGSSILHGGGVHVRAESLHAGRTGDNPWGAAQLEQVTTLDPQIICEYSGQCDDQNHGSCAVGTDETYWMATSAEIRGWNSAPRVGAGSNNQIARAAIQFGVANPMIPGSYVDAKQKAETDGNTGVQKPPNVWELLKVKCKLGFAIDRTKPVTFKCDLDFEPIEVINALFWRPMNPKLEPREVVTEGSVPTVWTTPPIPPRFTPGVVTKTSAQLTNMRTGSLSMYSFGASHCATGPCDWANVGNAPQAFGQASGYVGIKVTGVREVIKTGDFACHMAGNLSYNWWLPGIKQGPQGTPVFVDTVASNPPPEGTIPTSTTLSCTAEGCTEVLVTSDMIDTTNVADGTVDESLYSDLLLIVNAIALAPQTYEEWLAATSGTTTTTTTTPPPDAGVDALGSGSTTNVDATDSTGATTPTYDYGGDGSGTP